MSSIKGLIFDFDGLILDTEYAKFLAWQEIFHFYDLELTYDFIESVFGHVSDSHPVIAYLEEKLERKLDSNNLIQQAADNFHVILADLDLREGITNYFLQAQDLGLKMVIASNARISQISPLIDRLGIRDYFHSILTVEDVTKPKPDPEILNLALHRLGMQQWEVIAFDDSNVGLTAAKCAQIICVVVPNALTMHFHFDDPPFILGSFLDKPLISLLTEVSQKEQTMDDRKT